jgi:N-acetyltransferase
MRLEPLALTGTHVSLEPLRHEHASALSDAANRERSTYGFTGVPADVASMEAYIDGLLAEAQRDTVMPFVQRRRSDDSLVGCTRLMDLRWWPTRSVPAEAEIGGTWLAADAQGTAINPEAKLLLLTHAFEVWDVARIAIATDERNAQSRRAIEKLGASLDGILRNHRFGMGHQSVGGAPRNTAVYSIIPSEWPSVRDRLLDRLAVR